MSKRLDQILVVDIEATCWAGPPPEGQESEIIEIGLCLLDVATAACTERRSILVRPERSTVSPFCTELTTLTQAEVEEGIPLAEACHILQERYLSRERIWASYGDYDRLQFEKSCARRGIPYPFGAGHINVKSLFAVLHGLPREVSMARAVRMLGMELEGTYHRGGDDAYNIARILAHILTHFREKGASLWHASESSPAKSPWTPN